MMIPYTWNAEREYHGGGSATTQLSGGWRNYIRRGYVWQPISALIAGDLSCSTFPGNVQFAADSQGWSDIVIDGTFSMARHIAERNGHNAEPELRLSMQVECDHNVAGEVDEDRPWQVVYRGAWDCADLRLGIWQGRAARIEEVFDIHSMPSGDSEFVEYSFNIRSSHARVFAGPNLDTSPWDGRHAELFDAQAFVSRADSQLRGVLLKTPVAWYYTADGTEVRTPIRVTFEIQDDGETVRCTKHVPRALIATALANGSHLKADATFSPDANPESTTVDGMVRGSSQGSWATLIGGVANYVDDSGASGDLSVQATGTSNVYEQYRHMFFGFDTSSIGAGQQVDSATLRLNFDNQRLITSMGLSSQIYASSPASNTSLAIGDYMAFGSTPLTDSARDMNSESFDPTSITQTLNADGHAAINMEAVTNLGIGVTAAHESGSPTWSSVASAKINIKTAETTGTANDPLLTVTHSAASSFGAWYAAANPSGY
jgi:hypothetical protein